MLSYWEDKHFIHYDYVIVGGGIVGLSTALSIRKLQEDAAILVLEKGLFPSGASTKNAGFACFGSASEILADIQTMGIDKSMALVSDRWQGLQLLRDRLGDGAIGYKQHGGYEILSKENIEILSHLDQLNHHLKEVFQQKIFEDKSSDIAELGLNANQIKALVFNPLEAQVDTGALMKSLWSLAQTQDITILTGACVSSFQSTTSGVQVEVVGNEEPIQFITRRLAVCSNAFARELLPNLNLAPGRGQVLITKPLPNLKLKGVFHYQEGYYYFRNIDNRVMLGGGRNLDFEGEETTEMAINNDINLKLEEILSNMILPGREYEIDRRWSGIMAFGPDKRPLCGRHDHQVAYAVRLGGMGVALGSLLGQQLAELLYLKP